VKLDAYALLDETKFSWMGLEHCAIFDLCMAVLYGGICFDVKFREVRDNPNNEGRVSL